MRKIKETTYEVCPFCENEVELAYKFTPQICPKCGNIIMPCSICNTCTTPCPLEDTRNEMISHKMSNEMIIHKMSKKIDTLVGKRFTLETLQTELSNMFDRNIEL